VNAGFVRPEADFALVILTDEGKGFVEPRFAQHIKRISKYFSPLTDLEKEILLKILTKLRKTVA